MIVIASKIVFILSLLGILFIVGRKLSGLSRLPAERSLTRGFSLKAVFIWPGAVIKRLVFSGFFQDIIVGSLEKSLRKFKIMALKIDNILDKFLRKLKKKNPDV